MSKKLLRSLPYILPVLLLWILVVLFICSQYSNEKEHKAMELDAQLQLLNRFLLEDISDGKPLEKALKSYELPLGEVRITLIEKDGNVLYDNLNNAQVMSNHANREEVVEALQTGSGHSISRLSATNQIQYFYSATCGDKYIMRSALPYTVSLRKTMESNKYVWWMIVALTIVISVIIIVLLRIIKQRDIHYTRVLEQEQEKIVMKRQLTNNINHELKTPVASIQVCLETLINNPHLSDVQHAQMIDRCYQSCQRLRNLLSDVSLITRMEEGKEQIGKEPVLLNEIIDDLQAELSIYPSDKRMLLKTNFNAKVQMMGNTSLLVSIFRNLTENAMAYSEGKTIVITLIENTDHLCKISFEDDGVGVESQHLPHLFERFYRVDKGRSRQKGGTGLGLAIVKHSVQFHGGTICVENKPEGGLRFLFTLMKA